MALTLLYLTLVLVSETTASIETFEGWLKLHEKEYEAEQREVRQAIWQDNVRYVEEYNKRQTGVVLQINQFGDLTSSEFRALRTRKLTRNLDENVREFKPPVDGVVPDTKDWREENVVTPVKNQGDCGACYAFSAVSVMSSMLAIKTGELVPLSEQQVVDCSGPWGDNGCDGGAPQNVFHYAHETAGLERNTDYPYTGTVGSCTANYSLAVAQVDSIQSIKKYSEQDLKWAVGMIGPVSVGVDAGERSFQFYKSGVYSDPMCITARIDHAVVVVGYGTTDKGADYWIVKNSWGVEWGIQGYFWLARNKQNMCGVASQAVFPFVSLRIPS
ncbi:hypothetical protein ACHWQZ_G010276 [Mnemiopsis leidyi]